MNVPVLTDRKKKGGHAEISRNEKLRIVKTKWEEKCERGKLCLAELKQETNCQNLLNNRYFK